jgi:Sulfotransferase domain
VAPGTRTVTTTLISNLEFVGLKRASFHHLAGMRRPVWPVLPSPPHEGWRGLEGGVFVDSGEAGQRHGSAHTAGAAQGAPSFPEASVLKVHCAHHRAGTGWFEQVLGSVTRRRGGLFQDVNGPLESPLAPNVECLLFNHATDFDPAMLGGRAYRGSHMIRDPRDMAVSGYFYHLWSPEPWLHEPMPRFDGKTYQEHLNSLSKTEGLLAEIRRVLADELPQLVEWRYDQPEFLELRYEQMIADEGAGFARLFRHWGLDDSGTADALRVAGSLSFQRRTGRTRGQVEERQHLRSGASGQWQDQFEDVHREVFKEGGGEALIMLGYEHDADW